MDRGKEQDAYRWEHQQRGIAEPVDIRSARDRTFLEAPTFGARSGLRRCHCVVTVSVVTVSTGLATRPLRAS